MLNAEGHRTGRGNEFTAKRVSAIRRARRMTKSPGWRKPAEDSDEEPLEGKHGSEAMREVARVPPDLVVLPALPIDREQVRLDAAGRRVCCAQCHSRESGPSTLH